MKKLIFILVISPSFIFSKCEPTKKEIEKAKLRYPLECECPGIRINGNSWRLEGDLTLSKYGVLSGTLVQSSGRLQGFSAQFSIQFRDSTSQHFYTYTSGITGVNGNSSRQVSVNVENIPEYVLYNTYSLTCTPYKASSGKTGQYYADQFKPIIEVVERVARLW